VIHPVMEGDSQGVYTQLQDPVAEPNDVEKGAVNSGDTNPSGDGGCEGGV